MRELNEKCAVAAFVGEGATEQVAETLFALQHRGQEATGITAQTHDGSFVHHREQGLVSYVYDEEVMTRLAGSIAIGHDRYSTSGSRDCHKQPIIDENIGFALAHNGNLPVTEHLEDFLQGHHINTQPLNDTEMLGLAVAQNIRQGDELPDAVEKAYPLFRGAFSCVAMHDGLVAAFRDPKGIRPQALGQNEDGYSVSSETCGLETIGATYLQEVPPGAMAVISKTGIEEIRQLAEGEEKLDMFEYVYFSRPDSKLYGQRVAQVRRRLGQQLAEQHPPISDDTDNVIVIPIPDTSIHAAKGYARALDLDYEESVVKSRYIGRTFIQPSQGHRTTLLKRKHTLIPEDVKDRDVVFIDDSIVRLNTMPRLVQQARAAGAKTISVLAASAPVRFPDYYGIDTPMQSELAAANMTIEQMREKMKADYLGYLSISGMVAATGLPAHKFNLSPFNGEYPIGIGNRKEEIKTPASSEFMD